MTYNMTLFRNIKPRNKKLHFTFFLARIEKNKRAKLIELTSPSTLINLAL